MKMDKKLTLLFSLLVIVMTLANSLYAYQYNMSLLKENTYNVLSAVGNKMLTELESYLQLMSYAIEELTTNVDFMNAFRKASIEGKSWSEQDQLDMQKLMYQSMYEEPLMENFYRVSVYAPNGFYLSNHFEKAGAIPSLSEEARGIVASLSYLQQVNTSPSATHIIGPHGDQWSTLAEIPPVFSSVRAIDWHGIPIGYIEVSSSIEELVRIFRVRELPGLTAHALFDDGTQLFRFFGDDAFYPDANDTGMTVYTLEDGSERFAICLRSKTMELNVYVAQDIAVYHARSNRLLIEHLAVSGTISIIGVVIIIIISKGLTKSIRNLTMKVQHISSRRVVNASADMALDTVTSPGDKEISALETVFDELMVRLRHSAQREVSLQNTTLQAQLNALQAQINPHFVYNTLNIISAKGMESGNEEIIEICDLFAQMLRYSTDVQSRVSTLAAEVQNAKRYLLLTKARYEDQLTFSIDMPADAEDLLIPRLTLQPLIENAITHGFKGQSGQRVIQLTGEVSEDKLRIIIRDNGSGFEPTVLERLNAAFAEIDQNPTPYNAPSDGHIGLINTYLRLHYYSRGKIRMSIYNDGGAVVELNIPCERSDAHV